MSKARQKPAPKTFFWDRLPLKTRHIICLLFLFILPAILFHQTVIGNKTIVGSDIVQWRAGAQAIIQARQQYHNEPLWDTNMFSGMPAYLISFMKAVPNIDSFFFGLFAGIFPAAQFWVLLAGVYFFLILQDIKPLSATLGAIAVGFTTYVSIIIGAGHNSQFMAYVLIPWVMVGYWLLTRSKISRWLAFFAFTLAMTLELRANHPQVTYDFMYLMGIWWLYDIYQAYKEQKIPDIARITGFLVAAGIIAALANLQPYLSVSEFAHYTIRGGSAIDKTSGLGIGYAFNWSQGWGELLTYAVPGLLGGSSAKGTYWGPKSFTSGPHYLGAIILLLIVLGIAKSQRRLKWVFVISGTAAILFALGKHLMFLNRFMFDFVPFFSKFRAPEMWLMVTEFSFSIVAVYGLDWLIEQVTSKKYGTTRQLAVPLGIVIALAILLLTASNSFLSYQKPGEREALAQQVAQQNQISPNAPQVQQAVSRYLEQRVIPNRRTLAIHDSLRFLLFVIIGAIIIIAAYTNRISVSLAALFLVLLTAGDLLSIDNHYYDRSSLVPDTFKPQQVVEHMRKPIDTFLENHTKTDSHWSWRVLPMNENPFNNAVPAYFYPSLGGYTGAKLSIYQDLINHAMFDGPKGINTGVMDMLNTRYITLNREIPLQGFKKVYSGKDGIVLENERVLPKAFYVDSLVYANSAQQALDDIKSPFDPHKYAVVEGAQNLKDNVDSTATVSVTTYRPRKIELKTTRKTAGFLVLSEIYYPAGWKAFIDGKHVPIIKTNYVLRGLSVPAGNHTITLTFNPSTYTIGTTVAWIATILIYLIGIIGVVQYYRMNPIGGQPSENES